MTRVHRLIGTARDERGYSLVELLTVMAILGVVMSALTTLFVTATKAENDMNNRFQAQQNARIAVTKIRREAHCASSVVTTATSAKLTLPSQCKTAPPGGGDVTWCTVATGSTYALYRKEGATCDATGVKWAEHILAGPLGWHFAMTASSTDTLAKLNFDFPIDLTPSDPAGRYRLDDAIALRNSKRVVPTP